MANMEASSNPVGSVKQSNEDGASESKSKNANSNPGKHRRGRFQDRGGGRGRGQNRGRTRGHGANDRSGRNKKGDMGRGEWSRNDLDKRKRNDDEREKKRQKIENGEAVAVPFSKEEIEAETRRPKRKVAVMIGYAGSGYKGMQINGTEKTIEGDIFKAFVAASAISKANADDPKKSSLVRCARTDKGVHAAGNVISLKLIVEDEDVVQNINKHLPSQIRVWGIQRTNGSFSCYQTCDSRWYEYLIPTYAFLPPHPKSFLGKKLVESAEKEGIYESYKSRQEDVASFWEETEKKFIEPLLEKLDPQRRADALAIIHSPEDENCQSKKSLIKAARQQEVVTEEGKVEKAEEIIFKSEIPTEGEAEVLVESEIITEKGGEETIVDSEVLTEKRGEEIVVIKEIPIEKEEVEIVLSSDIPIEKGGEPLALAENAEASPSKSLLSPLEVAVKEIKAAYITAKKAYRISEARRQKMQDTLSEYVGTRNFHNYTIQKTFHDPSAKRHTRSFKVADKPIIINDTEWLSLKVHGQSFMMHQIRKMVAMAALVVRCGASKDIMGESYGSTRITVPKAPGLGLLLERPVFDSYNVQAVCDYNKEKIDFDNYQKEMDEFKQREIYDRIFREEEESHQFHTFFHHLDHYQGDSFLWVTASGISAASIHGSSNRDVGNSDDEADPNGGEG